MTKKEIKHPIFIKFSGYGHYKITGFYRNKEISATTNCMPDIDDFKDEDNRRHNKGYNKLYSFLVRENKNNI